MIDKIDKRTVYSRAQRALSELPPGSILSTEAIRKVILMKLTSNDKNIAKTLKLMIETNLIRGLDSDTFEVTNGNL